MIGYVQTNEEGRLVAASEEAASIPERFEFEFPEDFDWARMADYRVRGDKLVFDPIPEAGPTMIETLTSAQADIDEAVCALYELMLEGGA